MEDRLLGKWQQWFPSSKAKLVSSYAKTFTDPWWNEKSKDNIVSFHKVKFTELPYILRLYLVSGGGGFLMVKINVFYENSVLLLFVASLTD